MTQIRQFYQTISYTNTEICYASYPMTVHLHELALYTKLLSNLLNKILCLELYCKRYLHSSTDLLSDLIEERLIKVNIACSAKFFLIILSWMLRWVCQFQTYSLIFKLKKPPEYMQRPHNNQFIPLYQKRWHTSLRQSTEITLYAEERNAQLNFQIWRDWYLRFLESAMIFKLVVIKKE